MVRSWVQIDTDAVGKTRHASCIVWQALGAATAYRMHDKV